MDGRAPFPPRELPRLRLACPEASRSFIRLQEPGGSRSIFPEQPHDQGCEQRIGGVRIDGSVVSDKGLKLDAGTYVVQVGKRKFARVHLS